MLRTVAAILANPRYTGRQVWNRQRTDHGAPSTAVDLLGESDVRRWNSAEQWVISKKVAHPPLVSEQDFVDAQATNAVPVPADGLRRRYLLVGLLRCQECGRVLDSHWVNKHPAYRCRHGYRSTTPTDSTRPRNVYVHESKAIAQLAGQLGLPSVAPQAVVDYLLEHESRSGALSVGS